MEEPRIDPELALPVHVPGSHTSTQQWQSFELRMRRRRAGRLLDRAAEAIRKGALPAAREALDEARTLDPTTPGLQDAAARLDVAERRAATRRPGVALQAVAAAVTAAICAGSVFLLMSRSDADHAPPRGSASPAPAVEAAAATPVSPSVQVDQSEILLLPPEPEVPAEALPTAPQPREIASSRQLPPERVRETPVAPAGEPPTLADGPAAPSRPPQAPAAAALTSPVPERAIASSSPLPSGPGVTPGLGQMPLPMAAAEPNGEFTVGTAGGAPPRAVRSEEGARSSAAADERLVRAVLGRYEAAYSALDAAAAGAVWPSVDRRALERAFDSLSSQDLSLGACNIDVSGSSARAECSGRVRWTPRVGSGTQTASRRWRFELRNDAGDWRIVQANVQ